MPVGWFNRDDVVTSGGIKLGEDFLAFQSGQHVPYVRKWVRAIDGLKIQFAIVYRPADGGPSLLGRRY